MLRCRRTGDGWETERDITTWDIAKLVPAVSAETALFLVASLWVFCWS